VSLPLKLAALFAIALALFNGQCIANCRALPCQTQDDAGLPPCHQHQHHDQQSKACAQPAALDSAPVAQSLVVLATVGPIASIDLIVEQRPQSLEPVSPPDPPLPFPLPLRI
jgi:hypothetical protein